MSSCCAAAAAFAASIVPPAEARGLARIEREALAPDHDGAIRREKR